MKNDGKRRDTEDSGSGFGSLWVVIGIVVALFAFWYLASSPTQPDTLSITYSQVIDQAEAGNVSEVTLSGQELSGSFTKGMWQTSSGALQPATESSRESASKFKSTVSDAVEPELIDVLTANGVNISFKEDNPSIWPSVLMFTVPIVLIVGFWLFISRRAFGSGRQASSILNFGQSRARVYDTDRPGVTFADVAGEDEAKAELSQVVDFLRNPIKYQSIGARLPKGVLLVGPPGTGKTLLARAIAGEAGVAFITISASEFVEMFVGVGASRVRDLFERAKDSAPAIIFVDELDAVGRQRFAGIGGGNDEREQTLNQLLVEMDGFDPHETVVVLAATNRPDVLDPALLRPGRFDRQVAVGLPDRRGREAILRVHTRGISVSPDVVLSDYAAATPGFSGADLANLVNEAALIAAGKDRASVGKDDLDQALDKILLGTERSILIGEREKQILANHEAGHALVAARTPGSDPLRKISIIPRGQALGVTIQSPLEDRVTYTRSYLLNRLAILLGGRAAEALVFDDLTTGAQNDLKEATTLARQMVGLWGMSTEVGPYFLGLDEQHVFLGREITRDHQLSDDMLNRAEEATQQLLQDAYDHATRILIEERAMLDRLATALIENETLDVDQIRDLLEAHPVERLPVAISASADLVQPAAAG
jgi:cell division protease FtsH